jgi:hypothetical protein
MAIAEHARLIRGLLDDIKAGRPINTSGDVQAALEAAVTSLSSPTAPTALQPLTSAYPKAAADAPFESTLPEHAPQQQHTTSSEHDAAQRTHSNDSSNVDARSRDAAARSVDEMPAKSSRK